MTPRRGRTSPEEIERAAREVGTSLDGHPWVRQVLDNLTEMTLVLDEHRQIVFANRPLLEVLGIIDPATELYGRRPGEALACVNSWTNPEGCGTAEACTACGANLAILSALAGKPDERECRILRDENEGGLDFLVKTTPLQLDEQRFLFCTFTDIGAEKRRELLERTFFHDVLNSASVVSGCSRLMTVLEPEKARGLAAKTFNAANHLIEEIKTQRDLLCAENGEVAITPADLDSRAVLQALVETWSQHELAVSRALVLADDAAAVPFRSDGVLLGRVLSNMIKNALEGTPEGGRVTVSCAAGDGAVSFSVHNPGEIPHTAQLQIFQRSFSTRGAGRGIGTYSMKLLTERYLGGHISFTSTAAAGTTFVATYPV